ncbi:hypothetical protein K0G53_26610, partial [Bacteroides faecis]|uniref:hypothetical protein n=1 Tax=Bacteroides faecis TaxID=674529 RepID=UPI001F1B08DF
FMNDSPLSFPSFLLKSVPFAPASACVNIIRCVPFPLSAIPGKFMFYNILLNQPLSMDIQK